MSVEIISGPPVSGPQAMSKEAAEQALLRNASFPKGADYTLTAHRGHWVAAISTPDFQKQAEFPPASDDDSDSGSSDGPPSDSGDSDAGSDDSGSPDSGGDDGGSSDGPPKHEHGEHGDKGGGIHELVMKIDLLLSALGIDPAALGGDPASMAGGPDAGGPPPPPAGGPMGHKAPDVTVHERAMKPGETPPGGTPMGAPAFSSVQVDPNHPWAHFANGAGPEFFTVREAMGDDDVNDVHEELQQLAKSAGFRVARFTPFHDEHGGRNVEAVIQTPKRSQ